MEFAYLPAVTIAQMVRNKEVSPVEVVESCLNRIEKINPSINAFCTLVPELALEDARRAEKMIMSGSATGPLHGVPVGIKDLTPVEGVRTTFGSLLFKNFVPRGDAIPVARLKKAGAIVIGKTNTPEFGHKGTTDNLLFGTTKNPWNLEMTPGGSSGGSAAAVAAGMVPIAEGSDGGGSIRIPASFCGIFGFKPSYGRIPFDGNPRNMFSSQTPYLHYGPLARTVEDAALMFSIMTGYDASDPYSLPDMGEDFVGALKMVPQGMRIAYSPDLGMFEVDAQVQGLVAGAVANLRSMGLKVDEIPLELGNKADFDKAFEILWFTQVASAYGDLLPGNRDLFSRSLVPMIEGGLNISALEYKEVEWLRTSLWYRLQQLLTDYDLLITPTLAIPAFSHQINGPKQINGKDVNPYLDWMMTNFFNLTGQPAASVPVGFTKEGLPVGMQVVGPRLGDARVLQLSGWYEKSYPWAVTRPL